MRAARNIRSYGGVDLFDPVLMQNPYPLYARMRSISPVSWSATLHSVVLLGLEEVSLAYRDPRIGGMPKFDMPGMEPLNRIIRNWLLDKVPPEHTRSRSHFNPFFGRDALLRYEDGIRTIAEELLSRALEKGSFDFIDDFATPFPARVLSLMLGVPQSDSTAMRKWAESLYYCIGSTRYNSHSGYLRNARDQAQEGVTYFIRRLQEKRKNPGEDLISGLAQKSDGSGEADFALACELVLIVTAGYITSRDQLGNGLLALLRHPDQWRALCEDSSLIPGAVEEFLRYDSALHAPGHLVLEDMEFQGFPLKKGASVVTVIGAANRDPRVFEDPDRFDILRKENPHIAFGQGAHACLGSYLFRLEARIVFELLTKMAPGLLLLPGAPVRYQTFSLLIRGLAVMPLLNDRHG